MIKDTDIRPDEVIHGARSVRVQSTGASFGGIEVWIYSPAWKLCEPCTLGIFMEASSHRHDQTLIPFLILLLSQEIAGQG